MPRGLHKRFLRELTAEAHVVLKKNLNGVDAVLEHGEAVNADAEGEPTDFFGVVVQEAVDGGIDHAGAEELDPCRALAFRTGSATRGSSCSAAEGAGDVEFNARLGEWKIAGPEAGFHAGAEKLFYERRDRGSEISEGEVGVDGPAFDLVDGERI